MPRLRRNKGKQPYLLWYWCFNSRSIQIIFTSLLILVLFVPDLDAMSPRFRVNSEGRKLFGGYRIVPQPCISENNKHGVCMFNYECMQRAGTVMGACMDGFLFGACCNLPPGSLLPVETSSQPVKNALPAPSTIGHLSDSIIELTSSSTESNRPTPPTFKPKTTKKPTLVAEESVDNTASISHILNLLNESDVNTQKPEPSLSTWVSVNNKPVINSNSVTTQKYPPVTINAVVPATVTDNYGKPLTPRPTPSAPAPTVIVLGPFTGQEIPITPDVISRPSGQPIVQPVVSDIEQTTEPPELVLPTFDDQDLNNKVHKFIDKIVNSLAVDFQNLEDVVLSKKNLTINLNTTPTPATTTTTAKPTRKPVTVASSSTTSSTTTTTEKPAPPLPIEAVEAETEDKPDFKRECGVRPLVKKGRIVGGKGAEFGEWPWQVLVRESTWLGLFTKNKCGGVLVTNKYVITAAHCQPGFLASLVAVLGEFDLSGELESRNAIIKNVKRVVIHRNYEPATFENDIALLELETPVTFDEHIVPICLPDDNADFTGRMATVSGWGRLKYGGGVPNVLQKVKVPVIENGVCQEMFHTAGHAKTIISSFLCAGYANGQKDSCEGDSGGPLSVEINGKWVLVGTVSHGIKCASPYLPGVYMRTTYYKPWLKAITGVK